MKQIKEINKRERKKQSLTVKQIGNRLKMANIEI